MVTARGHATDSAPRPLPHPSQTPRGTHFARALPAPAPRKVLGVSGSRRSMGTFVCLFVNELMMRIVCFRHELDAMDPSICGFASAREGLSHSPPEVVSVLKLEQLGLAGHADPASLARTLVCFLPDPSPTAPSPPE